MQELSSPDSVRGWRRLWRPRSVPFWMTLLFNGISGGLLMWERQLALAEPLRTLVLLLALLNTLMGLWWLRRLWQLGRAQA